MATQFETVNATAVIDIFLLLLIGVGPKIALVPFLEVTADLPDATKGRVVRKMLTTATAVAVILLILGGLLTRLLHFSPGALAVSSGIILLILAVSMVLGPADAEDENKSLKNKDPMQLAVFRSRYLTWSIRRGSSSSSPRRPRRRRWACSPSSLGCSPS